MKRLATLTLLFLTLAGRAAAEAWTNHLEIADRHALATLTCRWGGDGLSVQVTATNHAAMRFRFVPGRKPDVRLLPAKLFPADFEDAIQSWPVPSPATNLVTFALRRQSHAWQVYLQDVPVARFPEPWPEGAVVVSHPAAALPEAAGRDQYVQRTAPFRFEDSFMVPKEDADKFPDTWQRCAGRWRLHTVTGEVSGTVRQKALGRQPTPEHSPNFYSLEGRGARAVVLAGDAFQHRYCFRAAVQHNGGTNGLLFLATESGACHGFTARTDPETDRLVFELWRGGIATNAPRQVLAAVGTELLPGQWTLMEVRVFDDRVVCLADNIEILRQHLPLPCGGRFGLFADTEEGTRFDDVVVASHEDYPFDSGAELAFHTLAKQGALRNVAGETPAPPGGAPAALRLEAAGGRQPCAWIFGATDDGPHQIEIVVQPPDDDFACGLLAGWQGPAAPVYAFTCRRAAGRLFASLERQDATNRVVLDAADLGPASREPLRLTLDGLRVNELRGLVNGRLVALARPAAPLSGAGGVRIEGRGRLRLSLPRYVSAAPVYADRFEKNPAFVNDPFMRHWASPEGQWITMRDGLTWLRGDIMGRVKVRLPAVNPSALHLAIPEDATNGQCVVQVRNGRLAVYAPAAGTNAVFGLALTNIPETVVSNAGALRLYTVNLEDDLLWISWDGAILGRCHLPPLAKGRRARVEGLNLGQLHQTLVRRENVFDTLFNESLCNWNINGGTWEVVNRFACEPTWSHMNGENGEGFAGLWSRYEMSGDFCVELYAGMRMGWYERPGDFNLTVCSRRDATCDGYSLTTAGWDPDHSQLYTRLFRDGVPCAASTAYTAPRVREGSHRGGYEPLISSGRDVHGAWYGVRFRRVGDRLSSVFDNEPVISWRDPAPLAGGTLGVWTYRNSVMIARVRIAAESVRPRPYRFWPLPAEAPPPRARLVAAAVPGLRVNDRPVEWLDPAVWQEADAISRPLLRFDRAADGRPEMRVTSLEGAGTFLAAPHLPPLAADRLLGWRFEVARHPEARFNFEFSVGRPDKDGAFVPATRYSHVICGSDETRGERRLSGRLPAAPAASEPDAEGRACVWTPVEVWLPSEAARKDLLVAVDGFGNLQPSDIQQGLCGNPPGAWYAIRHFREIYSGPPVLTGPAAVRAELDAFTQAAAKLPRGRLHEMPLPGALDARAPVIAWAVRPEAEFALAVRRDDTVPDALRVASSLPWSSPLLPARGARLDDQAVMGWQEGNDYLVLLPRAPGPAAAASATLTLDLFDGRTFRQIVPLPPAAAAASGDRPVLLACEMPAGSLQTFEARAFDPQQHLGRAGLALSCTDALQGASIRFQNAGVSDARLDGRVLPNYDPVATPLLQFRYKADPMARVSLSAGRCNMAFAESWGTSVGEGATGILDNAWHTWLGTPLLAFPGGPLRQGYAVSPGELRVASRSGQDQTGHYSAIAFDDIASGPAVGPKHPLTFRPLYSDRTGLAEVLYALASGPTPWSDRTDADRAAAHWIAATNEQVVTPDTAALPEGVHHLVTRARNPAGCWSAVYDVPFLLDRQPPRVSHAVRAVPDRYNGTCLDIQIDGDFAPPVARDLRFSCNGENLDLTADNGLATCSRASLHFEIDWPWLLRKFRRDAKDGDTIALRLDHITDAAGNDAPALQIPIKLNFADDKQPPAVNPLAPATNLLVFSPAFRTMQDFFNNAQLVVPQPAQQENGCSFVPFRFAGPNTANAFLSRQFPDRPWEPESFPWLALSVRVEGEAPGAAPFALLFRPSGNLPEEAVKPKNGNAYAWSLPTADGQPFAVGHIDWRPGRWNDLLINVRDLLRDQAKVPKACGLREISLTFPDMAKYTLQIRGMAILAPWGPNDVLRFQAYDLNGVAGLVWQNGGKSDKTGIRPARVALPPDDAQWLKLRVADRPGNLSPVFLIPMPPPAAPVPDNLPLAVAVENY